MSENVQQFSARLDEFSGRIDLLQTELGKAIYGQETVIRQLLAAVFARGHCLLIGVPGLAKTLMVHSLAQLTSLSFKRIQFTPDLMPSDIAGTNVIDESSGKREFRFVPGPVFAHIVLADEINRTPPKTQAALMEAMQERQVTVGQTTYDLPHPFMVAATQNPIEMEGTYPLPEAQLDRFMFSVHIDYPVVAVEERILAETTSGERPPLHEVIDGQGVLAMQRLVEDIVVSRYVVQYAARLVRATRPNSQEAPKFVRELVEWGTGPRAGQHLVMGAKAMAAMDGRLNVAVQDVKDVALPVLRHRIACNFQAQAEGTDSLQIVQRLLEAVEEPEVPKYE
ncbi:MAG: MoxR family ATPase [Candidatus Brocadiia bacterium]|jgi:MoxR-like ATPase|nr:MoxR family ATPase [Candidatus Brocadiia bacterium]